MRLPKRRSDSKKPQPVREVPRPQAVNPVANDIPDELVAARAYEIWQRRGCPMGQDSSHDWHAAREELEQERLGWAAPRQDDKERDPA
jgi:hypothetical protein